MNSVSQVASLASSWIRDHAFQLNFYRAHLFYFVITILITSAVFWGSNSHGFQVEYVDALTMCASAMTSTGLSTINLSSINAYQQSILFVLMALGDLSIASVSVVYVRRYFFRKRLTSLSKRSKTVRRLAEDVEEQQHNRNRNRNPDNTNEQGTSASSSATDVPRAPTYNKRTIRQGDHPEQSSALPPHRRSFHHGYGGFPAPWEIRAFRSLIRLPRRFSPEPPRNGLDHRYLSFSPDLDERVR